MSKQPGYLVTTKDEKQGRTFNEKGFINKKVPVYLATDFKNGIPIKYSDSAILCDPATLKINGFID